jgi:hypothetical protein
MPTASKLILQRVGNVPASGVAAGGTQVVPPAYAALLLGNLNELFDAIQPSEAAAGRTDYRLLLMQNTDVNEDFIGLKAYISSQTSSPNTSLEIGVAIKSDADTITAITAETTAPAGVTFSSAANLAAAVTIGDLAPASAGGTSWAGLWLKRIVSAGAAATANDASMLVITNAA